mgnify:CR=1 FL=1
MLQESPGYCALASRLDGPVPEHEQGGYDYWLGANLLEFVSEPYHTVLYDRQGAAHELPGYRVDAITDEAIRRINAAREDDVPEGERARLRGDLLRELVFSSELRPRIPAAVLDRFQRKLHRTWPGYAPRSAGELVEWVKERLLIPAGEWRGLLAAVERDAAADGARREFIARFQKGAMPDEIPDKALDSQDGKLGIAHLLRGAGLVSSTSEAFRMIKQGAVRIDGERVADRGLEIEAGSTHVYQVGKRKFCKATIA